MPRPDQDSAMLAWAQDNLLRGCRQEDLLSSMLSGGMGWRAACSVLAKAVDGQAPVSDTPSWSPEPCPGLFAQCGAPDGSAARAAFSCASPSVALIEGMLSPQEAAALIELGRDRLGRSLTVAGDAPGGEQAHPARSSSGAHISDIEHPVVKALLARASWAFGCPQSHFEKPQILRYLPGQEYKPHHDWFEPSAAGAQSHLRRGGQRIATVVIYLNDCPAGGGTIFPQLGMRVLPNLGNAVFFAYPCDGSQIGDARLLHGGEPVLEGEKWACTLWMRQAPFV